MVSRAPSRARSIRSLSRDREPSAQSRLRACHGKILLSEAAIRSCAGQFPDVPAVAEVLPGYDSRDWFGYLAPAGTPPKVVALLNQEINRAMMAPDVREKIAVLGMTVVAESPESFSRTLKGDYEKYGKLIRTTGFQPQ